MKKGISPLIATILLIGFTVVIAAIVLTWGQGWFGSLTQSTSESAGLQLACVNQGGLTISEVCAVSATSTRITLINTGNLAHASCTLSGEGSSIICGTLGIGGVGSYTLGAGLSAGGILSSVFTLTTDLGTAVCQGSSYIVPAEGLQSC